MKRFSTLGSNLLIAVTAFTVTTFMADSSTADIVEGLVNYWSLDGGFEDEAEGVVGGASTVDDELRLSDPNALGSTLTFSETAMFGLAVEMTGGENDGHLLADPSQDVVGAPGVGGFLDGNMSISVWAQATALESGWQAIVAHGEGGGYRLHRRGSDSWAAFTGNSSGDTDPAGPTTDISPGTGWHHFAARVTDNVAELWVDGQFQGSEAEGSPEDRGNGVHIGMNPDTSGREWLGQIDDLGMWNRGITDSEIFQIYTNGLSGCSLLDDTCGTNPFIPTSLPGPAGSDGQWGVRDVTNNGTIDSIQAAGDSLTSGLGTITDGQMSILDVADPDTNPDGGPTLPGQPLPYLSNTGGDDDNIATIAKGRINVVQGGDYTFNVNADDGFGLRIVGRDFTSASNGGIIDPADPTTLARLTPGGALGVANLPAGEYDLEVLAWENTGDGHFEVTSAQGVITDPDQAQWIAVGDPSSVAGFSVPPTVFMPDLADAFNMGSVPEMPSTPGGNDGGVGGARQQFFDGNFLPNGDGVTDIVALHDPESGNNLGGTSTPFPGQVDGTDDNDFTTAVLGSITVDNGNGIDGEQIPLTFSVQSDDNGAIHIFGSSFETSNQPLIDWEGDQVCAGDFNSGNVNTTCTITLEEGTHNFEAYHREQGGGAYFQVWWADGHQAGFSASEFTILSTDDTPTDIPANTGLALVGGGVVLPDCDFDDNGACELGDIDQLMYTGLSSGDVATYDLNGDTVLDLGDRDEWYRQAGSLPGDANLDGVNNAQDLNPIGVNWQGAGITSIADGDNNGDGVVDVADLNGLGLWWTKTAGDFLAAAPAPQGAAVPEPTGMMLSLAALFGLLLLRRKN